MSLLTALERETGQLLGAAAVSLTNCREAIAARDKGAAIKAADDLTRAAWSIHHNVGWMGNDRTEENMKCSFDGARRNLAVDDDSFQRLYAKVRDNYGPDGVKRMKAAAKGME